jgi:dCTP deaminase
MAPALPFPAPDRGQVRRTTGILPYQQIVNMIREREILARQQIERDQVQPASLDLRLGNTAYRVRASFLPGAESTVEKKISQLDAYTIDLSKGAVLERGCVYVIPLLEALDLKSGITAFANPKSSTGRLDILTRLITDQGTSFDLVQRGYNGPLYVEVAPRTFSVVVRAGDRLNQIRFRRGTGQVARSEIETLRVSSTLEDGGPSTQPFKEQMVGVTIDLKGASDDGLVGWTARRHTDRIDLRCVGHYDPFEFWEPIYSHQEASLILDPDAFYILATREAVRVPPAYAAEMVAYDTNVGEFRVHYAGFFDPGFGHGSGAEDSRAVLEVRSHEVPFVLEHGQTIGWLRYEHMAGIPDRIYGSELKSNYQGQRLALAKQFRQPTARL